MLGLMKKQLNTKKFPFDYELCFNSDCQLRERCLHYQAYQLQRDKRLSGPAIYPSAWQSGRCVRFCEDKPVQKAWGFTNIYKNVPQHLKAQARRQVQYLFSMGCGPYYRYHHGENLLTPAQQADIMEVLSHYGSTKDLAFDHYEADYDFS